MMLIPKLVLPFKRLHGIISFKMNLFITTAERTSNFDLDYRFEYSFSMVSFYCPSIENGKWASNFFVLRVCVCVLARPLMGSREAIEKVKVR
jgi:hypothetical protein